MERDTRLFRESDMKEFRVIDYRTSFTSYEVVIKSISDDESDTIVERNHDVWVSIYEKMNNTRNKYIIIE